jgi:hypothetical protein
MSLGLGIGTGIAIGGAAAYLVLNRRERGGFWRQLASVALETTFVMLIKDIDIVVAAEKDASTSTSVLHHHALKHGG